MSVHYIHFFPPSNRGQKYDEKQEQINNRRWRLTQYSLLFFFCFVFCCCCFDTFLFCCVLFCVLLFLFLFFVVFLVFFVLFCVVLCVCVFFLLFLLFFCDFCCFVFLAMVKTMAKNIVRGSLMTGGEGWHNYSFFLGGGLSYFSLVKCSFWCFL